MTLTLHSYWRSTAAYRVRIALNLKGVAYDQATHDLRTGAQRDPIYLALAPQGLVPALETPEGPLTQSVAILEWIEERWPQPALLPHDAYGRAARAFARRLICLGGDGDIGAALVIPDALGPIRRDRRKAVITGGCFDPTGAAIVRI